MRAHKAKTITRGAAQIAGACLDSSRGGVPEPRCKRDTAGIDDLSVSALISFFEVLDRWDREAKGNGKTLKQLLKNGRVLADVCAFKCRI
jgi:hypothetical protein